VLAEKELEVSGMPWLNGQTKALGFGALTARCLCAKHNSLLSPIDVVGANFFEAIQKCGTTETGLGLNFLLSGHDVERWMLRTLAVFGVSKNFAIDGAVVDQDFVARLRIVESSRARQTGRNRLAFICSVAPAISSCAETAYGSRR
jgi:hypothetical protein